MDELIWALALAALPVAGAVIVAFVPRWSEVRERRRSRYAEALAGLVAWAEFPYLIARRVDDDAETLAELAALGHDLQQRLAFLGAWISAENSMMGDLYQHVADALRAVVAPAASEAWQKRPVTSAAAMNIGDLGIDQSQVVALTARVASASRIRFGWRRLLGKLNARRKVFSASVPPPEDV